MITSNAEKSELSYVANRNVKCKSHSIKQSGSFLTHTHTHKTVTHTQKKQLHTLLITQRLKSWHLSQRNKKFHPKIFTWWFITALFSNIKQKQKNCK